MKKTSTLLLKISIVALFLPVIHIAEAGGRPRALSAVYMLLLNKASVEKDSLPYPIVDTGVTDFYSNNAIIATPSEGEDFYGQDGQYAGNQPSYTDQNDGTVTDNVTGLMWQQDMGVQMTWSEAHALADSSELAGYTDWRLPTIKELYSLILFTGANGDGENEETYTLYRPLTVFLQNGHKAQ